MNSNSQDGGINPNQYELMCRPPEGSATSNIDSGHGSMITNNGPETGSQHIQGVSRQLPSSNDAHTLAPITGSSPAAQSSSPIAVPQQRKFDGLNVFDADKAQVERYNEILNYITQPLNLKVFTREGY